MGMSTHLIGFRPPDDEWRKKKAVWDACEAAGVDPPEEVEDFFDGHPQDAGQEIDVSEAVSDYAGKYSSGLEVDLTKLPKGLRVLRFYNSW